MNDAQKDALADGLKLAWKKYVEAFGEPPHGTYTQLRAMLEFLPKDAIEPMLIAKIFKNNDVVVNAEELLKFVGEFKINGRVKL